MTQTLIYSPVDIIVNRSDNSILESQANVLVNYLPGWEVFEPFPNGGKAPAGSYTKIYSPIFQIDNDDLASELQKTYDGISKFITNLNNNGNGVSRIECVLEQSDDKDAVPHPSNSISGNEPRNSKYTENKDFKWSNWLFTDIFKTENWRRNTVYLNQTVRETNDKAKVTKKYYVLKISSSYKSI